MYITHIRSVKRNARYRHTILPTPNRVAILVVAIIRLTRISETIRIPLRTNDEFTTHTNICISMGYNVYFPTKTKSQVWMILRRFDKLNPCV